MLDRVDLYVSVPRLTPQELLEFGGAQAESSETIRKRVLQARSLQWERKKQFCAECNAEIPERVLRREIGLGADARKFLTSMAERMRLSGRGISRVLRVSRTIADLAGAEKIEAGAVAEALAYRDAGVLQ